MSDQDDVTHDDFSADRTGTIDNLCPLYSDYHPSDSWTESNDESSS